MTVETIQTLKELILECTGTCNEIMIVYEYTNAMNNQLMFAAFTRHCYNDIYESPAVLNPICIYKCGFWIGKYLFMNKVL